jgi:hypothetical protein
MKNTTKNNLKTLGRRDRTPDVLRLLNQNLLLAYPVNQNFGEKGVKG